MIQALLTRGEFAANASALGLPETLAAEELLPPAASTGPTLHTGAGNVTSVTSQTAVTSVVVDKPANVAVGDLLLAAVSEQNNANTTPPSATGWTALRTYNTTGDANRRPSGLYVLPVTDSTVLAALPSSWTWSGPTGSGRWIVTVQRITGVSLNIAALQTTVGAWKTPSADTATTITLPGVTVVDANSLVVAFSYNQASASTFSSATWSGLTEQTDVSTISGVTNSTHSSLSTAAAVLPAGATSTISVTWTGTPANTSGYVVALPPSSTAPSVTSTTMRVIAHRGTTTAAAANTENSVAGLTHLATLRRPVNGIEWDVRVSSDGELFLMHDETGARTHPAMGATGVEGYTASQLDTFGVTRLTTALAAVPGRGFERVNLQHYFVGSNTAAIDKMLQQINASTVAPLVKIMTSITGPYAPSQFRARGWTGPIGTYGSTAANYAGSGDGKAADFSTNDMDWAYMPPGGYTTNRAHAQALIAGGTIKAGASTENSPTQWAQAHADGVDELLTDDSAGFLVLYEPPEVYRGGSAQGNFVYAGTATGSTDKAGSATGTFTYAGTAQGSSDRSGTAGGTWTYAGSAAGSKDSTGTATGTFSYVGAAAGANDRSGSAVGTFAYAGTASGTTVRSGSATGSFTYAGVAQGSTVKAGSGVGVFAYTSTATGQSDRAGSSTGTFTYVGTAVGFTPVVGGAAGSALGSWDYTGTAAGASSRAGTASGTFAFAGSAIGLTFREGTSTGTWVYVSTAEGAAPVVAGASGTASGAWVYVGDAVGSVTRSGSATGSWSFAGSAISGEIDLPPERISSSRRVNRISSSPARSRVSALPRVERVSS